jgi:hypothetical protein
MSSWQLQDPIPAAAHWEPLSIAMVDDGKAIAILGVQNGDSNSSADNHTSVLYLCKGKGTIKALGNALHVMTDNQGTSADSEFFGEGLGKFDLSDTLSWPEELMDEGSTCCVIRNICNVENCEALRCDACQTKLALI